MPEDPTATQRDLGALKKYSDMKPVELHKGKCKVLHLCSNNLTHQYMAGSLSWKAACQKRFCLS